MSVLKKRKWIFKRLLATKDDKDSLHKELIELQENLGIEVVYDSVAITKFWSLLNAFSGLAQMAINKLLQLSCTSSPRQVFFPSLAEEEE